MKSLNDRYSETHGNAHETFADLMFCALVLLVLFVMALAVEVSQRVRADMDEVAEVTKVESVEDIESLSAEEVAALSERLQRQQAELESQRERMLRQQGEIRELRADLAVREQTVQTEMAALRGEQRFTGATEPASLLVAYDYRKDRFVFVRRKEFEHATTRKSGESAVAFSLRSTSELVKLALLSRRQRYYTEEDANRLYEAFTGYRQINPTEDGYSISAERLGVTYAPGLSGFIAGDSELPDDAATEIETVISRGFRRTAGDSDKMYPAATISVDPRTRKVTINGVELMAKDFKDLLLSFGGRGVMLDFEGYEGDAPDWLVEQVLTPTGYVGKTPKLP